MIYGRHLDCFTSLCASIEYLGNFDAFGLHEYKFSGTHFSVSQAKLNSTNSPIICRIGLSRGAFFDSRNNSCCCINGEHGKKLVDLTIPLNQVSRGGMGDEGVVWGETGVGGTGEGGCHFSIQTALSVN